MLARPNLCCVYVMMIGERMCRKGLYYLLDEVSGESDAMEGKSACHQFEKQTSGKS
jgi:hypothetical protein